MSFPPSAGLMNPKPFLSLNQLTLPFCSKAMRGEAALGFFLGRFFRLPVRSSWEPPRDHAPPRSIGTILFPYRSTAELLVVLQSLYEKIKQKSLIVKDFCFLNLFLLGRLSSSPLLDNVGLNILRHDSIVVELHS